jgi:hypothetical protein
MIRYKILGWLALSIFTMILTPWWVALVVFFGTGILTAFSLDRYDEIDDVFTRLVILGFDLTLTVGILIGKLVH